LTGAAAGLDKTSGSGRLELDEDCRPPSSAGSGRSRRRKGPGAKLAAAATMMSNSRGR
jgi:hypothetical protein